MQFASENTALLLDMPASWPSESRLALIKGLADQLDKHIFNNAIVNLTKDATFLNLNQLIALLAAAPAEELNMLRSRFKKTIQYPQKEFFFLMEG
ncbi:MAG: hypothetical protein V4478_02985 [Patescibacteria group bacterium]